MRTAEAAELMKHPAAFVLLAQIAHRARRAAQFSSNGLLPGEALIGDFAGIGLTRQQYRTATANLVKWQFVTIRATNRGTVARLIDTRVFDINAGEATNGSTFKQPTGNHPATTNKNERRERMKEREGFAPPALSQVQDILGEAEAQAFLDYYSARGWMLNGSQMADWQAAARGWKRRGDARRQEQPDKFKRHL